MYAGMDVKADRQSRDLQGTGRPGQHIDERRFKSIVRAESWRTSDGAHAPSEANYAHRMRLTRCVAALADHCLDDTAQREADIA